jgi:hypothetical protein
VQQCSGREGNHKFVTVNNGVLGKGRAKEGRGRTRGRGRGKGRGAREECWFRDWRGTFLRSSADRLWLVAGREIGLPNHFVVPQRYGPRPVEGCANPCAQLLGNGLSWLKGWKGDRQRPLQTCDSLAWV